jgi:hypothetical protein
VHDSALELLVVLFEIDSHLNSINEQQIEVSTKLKIKRRVFLVELSHLFLIQALFYTFITLWKESKKKANKTVFDCLFWEDSL